MGGPDLGGSALGFPGSRERAATHPSTSPTNRAETRRRRQRASVGKISAKCCSFSAVSAPIFARKYAFCSIFQNLPDYQTEFFEIWQKLKFANFATFAMFAEISRKLLFFQTDFLRNFWDWSGAKGCKSCRAWKMLSNAYFLAKIRFDTAENEPVKNLQNLASQPMHLRETLLRGRPLGEWSADF